jgi:hypothetical protein
MKMTDNEKLEMINIIENAYIKNDFYVALRLHRMMGFDYSLYKHDEYPVTRPDDDYYRYYGYDCIMHMKNNRTKKLGEVFLKTVSRSGK